MATCHGAYVHNVVSMEHHVLVVLHYNDGVANVTQGLQRVDESHVVALMEAYGGLVEYVYHVDQSGANLGGQPDALAFAAAEGG